MCHLDSGQLFSSIILTDFSIFPERVIRDRGWGSNKSKQRGIMAV